MKIKYRLLVSALLACAVLVISLAGCSGETTPAVTTPAPGGSPSPTVAQLGMASPSLTPAPISLDISAAASLTDAVKEINALYIQGKSHVTITPNFASSGTLQQQIEQGAPADVFISAASAQMNKLQDKGLIINETRRDLLYNKVVLIVPADSTEGIASFKDLATAKVARLAVGDPASVPAGSYAKQAFDLLGITAQVEPKQVLASDVRQVLTYVESGNVDAGIVYSTDALISGDKVKIVASAPDEINNKIVYPAAVVQASSQPEAAQEYLDFLFSDQAKAVLEKYGFTPAD